MVSNPMQRKTRNSFLLGMIITLVVCLIIGAVVFILINNKNKQKEEEEGTLTYVYRLKTNVAKAQEIKTTDVESIVVTQKAVPEGAFASKTKTTDAKGKETWKNKAFPSGYKSKIDLKAGTILSADLVYEGEDLTHDTRYVEYNMITLSTTIAEGDYIDVRITFPNGQNFIIISKKEVKSVLGDTIGMELTEEEILMMDSAIVEAYIVTASNLSAVQYVEPGIQEASIKTYTPTKEVQALIDSDSNITQDARNALKAKFIPGSRENMDSEAEKYGEDKKENIEAGIQKQIENAKAAREAYLQGLTSY